MPFFKNFRKNTSIFYDKDFDRAIEEIKKYLSNPPVLVSPISGEILYLYLDVTPQMCNDILLAESDEIQYLIYYVSQVLIDS